MTEVRIGVVGCAGRMGRMLLKETLATLGAVLIGGTEGKGHSAIGQDLGVLAGVDPIGVTCGDDPAVLFAAADAVLDFTVPAATIAHARLAAQAKAVHVVGTTGIDAEGVEALKRAGRHCPVVFAPNMSVGVNLLLGLVEQAAAALDQSFDIEIVEMHHRHKVDAPSGTALALGEAAARGRKVDLAAVSARARDGHTGERRPGDIGFAVLRGGDVPGDHTVIFAADGERIEISHRAGGRHIFARGAVRAALWGVGRKPGFYSMKDVLCG
ncbi:MAG: 4-hydroxy-tetrahydrodipicolinate reductase [Alphaproteobacteria bacterium]